VIGALFWSRYLCPASLYYLLRLPYSSLITIPSLSAYPKSKSISKKIWIRFSPLQTTTTTGFSFEIKQISNPKTYFLTATAFKIAFQVLWWNCTNRTYFLLRTTISQSLFSKLNPCLGLVADQ